MKRLVFPKSFYKVTAASTKIAVRCFETFDKFTLNCRWRISSLQNRGPCSPSVMKTCNKAIEIQFVGIGAGVDD